MPRRAKSVNRKLPGPKMSMWVLEPMGDEKLVVTDSISAMTNGIGLQPSASACCQTIGKNTALLPTSLTNSLTMDASRHITAMTTYGLEPQKSSTLLATTWAMPVLVIAMEKTTVAPRTSSSSHSMYLMTRSMRQHLVTNMAPAASMVVAMSGNMWNDEMKNISTRMTAAVMVRLPICGTNCESKNCRLRRLMRSSWSSLFGGHSNSSESPACRRISRGCPSTRFPCRATATSTMSLARSKPLSVIDVPMRSLPKVT